MSAAELAQLPVGATVTLSCDRDLADWQGRIALAAANGGGLDEYQAALVWAKQCVRPDNGLLEKVKKKFAIMPSAT